MAHATGRADAPPESPGLARSLALLAIFTVLLAVYFALAEGPFAIKHDMAEAYAWGRQFQLGYNQHPPFWAWICGLWFRVFPRANWAFSLLSALNAGIGLWGAWRAIGDFARGPTRRAAWVLLLLTPLYTFYAYKYNANIIFLSIWPWTLHAFTRSVQGGGLRYAMGFGVCAGLAMLSKYYALILLATCFLAALWHPRRRAWFASASPYIAAGVAAAMLAPHVWWLLTHRAPPLRYLAGISDRSWHHVLDYATKAAVGAVGMNLGVLLVVGVVTGTAPRAPAEPVAADAGPDPDFGPAPPRGVLAILALAPFVLTILSALVLRTTITEEMMVGIFPLLPLLTIELARLRDPRRLLRIAARLAGVLSLGAVALSPAIAYQRAYLAGNAMKAEPFQEVAIAATKIWHARTSLPLDYVAGSPWYGNEIVFYSPDRPHSFSDFHYSNNLWVTPQKLAAHGLLSVCRSNDRVCLAATARFATPGTTRTEITLAHRFWSHRAGPRRYVVTVIPPRR